MSSSAKKALSLCLLIVLLVASWLNSTWLISFLNLNLPHLTFQLLEKTTTTTPTRSILVCLCSIELSSSKPTQLRSQSFSNPDHPPTQLAQRTSFSFGPAQLLQLLLSLYGFDLSIPERGSANLSQFSLGTNTLATSSMALDGASSSSSTPRWDLFLSFRGKDTRNNFTAHLYATLRLEGIHTFIDDKLRTGEEISPALVKAIEESEISIIVLSKNYTSSRLCLDELMKILECRKTRRQKVLPLFYNVDLSEVRHQTNSIGKAFAKLEKRFKDDVMKVQRWKKVLKEVADMSGSALGNRNEAEFIREIIGWVNLILVKNTCFQVAEYPVGIKSHVRDLKSLLDVEMNDSTCMVGIFGIGGIGKTTIAKAIYNSITSQLEGSCFLKTLEKLPAKWA